MQPWERFKKFMLDEIEEMNKFKWIRSEEAARDLGQDALMDWVAKFAKEFRKDWEAKNGKLDDNWRCLSEKGKRDS